MIWKSSPARNSSQATIPTIERSNQYGIQMVEGYKAGASPRSLSVSSHGVETNVRLQAVAKMAEFVRETLEPGPSTSKAAGRLGLPGAPHA
jgi:hypothetical protein